MSENNESKIDENDVEYYAPDMDAAKPLKIHENEEDTDDFETRLDEKVIFQRVAKELYKYPASAIRELVVNALGHGARKANNKYGEDNKAYVDIHLHPHDRQLVITDVRGMGMTHKEIRSLMSYVGRSGNLDSKTAGQFGMGYFSYLKIADSAIVETKVREAYEYKGKQITSMAYLNNQGWQWQKTNTCDEDVDLEEPGTRITLTMNHEIDIYDVIRTIKEVAKYSDILVELTLDDDFGKMAAGKLEVEQIANLAEIHPEEEEQEVIELDDEEIYFKAVMFKNRWGQMSHDGEKVVLLARVPIDIDNSMIPTFSSYVLNIKDERKYKPLPDRERLADKSEKELKIKLEKLFKEHFGKLSATNAEELEAMPYKYPVLYMNNLGIQRFFSQNTKDFISSIVDHTVAHIIYDENKVTTEYGSAHTMHQVLAYRKQALLVHNKALAPIRSVQAWCSAQGIPEKKFLRIDKKTSAVAIALLDQWKVPTIKDFMKENSIKANRSGGRSNTGLTLHHRDGYSRDTEKITDFDDIEWDRTVWIKGPLKPWINLLSHHGTTLKFTKWNKKAVEYGIEEEESIITEATLYGMGDFEILTSKGKEMFSKWYDGVKDDFKTGYGYNRMMVWNDETNEVEKNYKQVIHTLGQHPEDVSNYNDDAKYINNAIILMDKEFNIHDTEGNEISISLKDNFEFMNGAYGLINDDDEVQESIDSQIENEEITVPAENMFENPDEKVETYDELFEESHFFNNQVPTRINSQGEITEDEKWQIYVLDIKNYFGIKNVYDTGYDWGKDYKLMEQSKKAIDTVYEDEDMQQLMLHAVTRCSYGSYKTGLNQIDGIVAKNIPVALKQFFTRVKKSVPEIDSKNKMDTFFKTRHILNAIDKMADESSAVKDKGFNSSARYFFDQLKTDFQEVNRKTQVTGHLEEFLNEFVKGSEAKVTESKTEISVEAKPEYFIYIKALIELHSSMELSEVHPKADKLELIFVAHKNIDINHDIRTESRWAEFVKHCPCGCKNTISEKVNRTIEDDDD